MFHFSLQRVLDFRRQLREKAESEVRGVQNALRSERSALQSREEEKDQQNRMLHARAVGRQINVNDLVMASGYLDALEVVIGEQRSAIRLLEQQLAEKMEILVIASQQEKVMERLKEHELKAYREKQTRVENAFMDEVAIRGYRYEAEE